MRISDIAIKTTCILMERKTNGLGTAVTLRIVEGLNDDLRSAIAGNRFFLGWASPDAAAAFRTEVRIGSHRTNTAGFNLSFMVHPDDVCDALLLAPYKSQWTVAWIELDDEDQPVEGRMSRDAQRAVESYRQLSAMPRFLEWLRLHAGHSDLMSILAIKDPEDLVKYRGARRRFRELVAAFYSTF